MKYEEALAQLGLNPDIRLRQMFELGKLAAQPAQQGVDDFDVGWNAARRFYTSPQPAQQQECQCSQGQVCHICDPIRPAQQVPCGWQFFQDGKWHNGMETNNHRANTEAAGIPVRDVYPSPQPAQHLPDFSPIFGNIKENT